MERKENMSNIFRNRSASAQLVTDAQNLEAHNLLATPEYSTHGPTIQRDVSTRRDGVTHFAHAVINRDPRFGSVQVGVQAGAQA